MNILMSGVSTLESFLQLAGLLIVFLLILVAAYFTSKFVGTSGVVGVNNKNFKVIETFKVAPNKFLQVIEVSGKYVVIGVCKDSITFLTELDETNVIKQEIDAEKKFVFEDILKSVKNSNKEKGNNKKL